MLAPNHQPLRADLIGAESCSAAGLTVHGHSPVLTLCRRLVEAGHDPPTPVFRGATLALTVRSIGEGAGLTVEECSDGRPRFRKFRPWPSEGSPPARQKENSDHRAGQGAEALP